MKIEHTIINVIFDAAKGRNATESREAVCGQPLGALPRPFRAGYSFDGWYLDGTLVTEETVLQSEEDVCLTARWVKETGTKKSSMLRRQKIAIAVLSALVVVLVVALLIVNHVVAIYSLKDVYVKDGVTYSDQYYVKKKGGSYGLYDKKGNRMEVKLIQGMRSDES